MGINLPVTFSTTVVPSIDQLVTSPKMLPGRLSPCWSTQSTCPVAEPSARSVTSIPNAVLPAASPGSCISAVPPPLMVATTVAAPDCRATMSAAGKALGLVSLSTGPVASLPLQPPATSKANTGKANRYVILSLHGDSQPDTHRA